MVDFRDLANLRSEAEIMKNTYAGLVIWIKELLWSVQRFTDLENLNYKQAGIIMDLEHEVNVMKEYGAVVSDVVSLEEFRKHRPKLKGGGRPPSDKDWLSGMKCETEFLVRPKVQKTWMLAKFMHAGLKEGVVLVIPMVGEEPVQNEREWMWVDPVEFCKYWELKAILLEPE